MCIVISCARALQGADWATLSVCLSLSTSTTMISKPRKRLRRRQRHISRWADEPIIVVVGQSGYLSPSDCCVLSSRIVTPASYLEASRIHRLRGGGIRCLELSSPSPTSAAHECCLAHSICPAFTQTDSFSLSSLLCCSFLPSPLHHKHTTKELSPRKNTPWRINN